MTTPTQIRIDSEIKNDVTILFKSLGLDMSSAINLFLHQCILKGGLPFNVEMPNYNKETLKAMSEAKKISHDKSIKGCKTAKELHAALNEE